MKKNLLMLFLFTFSLVAKESEDIHINFNNVPVKEFVRFVSRIAGINFIYDEDKLDFNITLVSGVGTTSDHIIEALKNVLAENNFCIKEKPGYLLIKEMTEADHRKERLSVLKVDQAVQGPFHVHKLQYHEGEEIHSSIKQIASDLTANPTTPLNLLSAIQSLQWIKATNSLFFTADDDEAALQLRELITSLDTPSKQVFIEVLVIETDIRNSLDFGLEWGATGQYGSHLSGALGSLDQIKDHASGRGFDLSVIGDIIFHKGKTFLTLGSLVSALQTDGDSTIVLNQKILTQDNKASSIFVGDNLPFTGTVVETSGSKHQTTANIEYRDVGVSLNIKPMLGNDDIVTLDITEEISQAGHLAHSGGGVPSTKTNMITCAHVPDKHFLVLSGMTRNNIIKRKKGIPILKNIPLLGLLFGKTVKEEDKRNIIIFVRPQIVNTTEEYAKVTARQAQIVKEQGDASEVEKAIQMVDYE